MGVFGISEVIASVRSFRTGDVNTKITLKSMLPTRDEMRRSWMPMARGSGIGSFFGILPGVGPTVACFMAYALEKKISKDPSKFGKGAIEGLVAAETTNNAADQTAFIPTLTLGIPGSATMAIIIGVLIIHGITPGPTLIAERPDMFWGLVMSFWIGNILLVILNIPMIGIWMRILTIPYHLLYPAIVVFICMGTYSVNNSTFDVLTVIACGAMGYLMRVLGFPAAPLILGFVLGPLLEENFRRTMIISGGNLDILLQRPLSLVFLVVTAGILFWTLFSVLRSRLHRRQAG